MTHRRHVDDEDHEEPSIEDLERFGHQSAYCPTCGAEVWDDAQHCSDCGAYFEMASPDPPVVRDMKRAWRTTAVLVGAVSFVVLVIVLTR